MRKLLIRAGAISALSLLMMIGENIALSNAQSPLSGTSHKMPEAGERQAATDGEREQLNPLPEGASFEVLGSILKELGRQPANMRGAQEIAIYRQAAPAVVLLKTKDGSGSGVVLQNGLILTNRHVVDPQSSILEPGEQAPLLPLPHRPFSR